MLLQHTPGPPQDLTKFVGKKSEESHKGWDGCKAWRLQRFEGRARVLDASVDASDAVTSSSPKVAKRGLCMTQTGTPYYASPEVWRDMPYDALWLDLTDLNTISYTWTISTLGPRSP